MPDQLTEDLAKLSPLAQKFLKVIIDHGGSMAHLDIVKELGESDSEALKKAVAECRASTLLYDKWPTAFDPRHTWTVSPAYMDPLQKALAKV